MQICTDGLIISQMDIGDCDKLVTVLTRKSGVIRAFVKGAKNIRNKNFAGTQIFCYSDFNIYKGRNKYIINESSIKKSFWKLRNEIEKLALAQYFCELILNLVGESNNTENILRLMLNSLYYISEDKLSNSTVKSIFEMRILAISGYMPDLIVCNKCSGFENNDMYFIPSMACLLCHKCYEKVDVTGFKLKPAVLFAIRHTVYSEFNKMFCFEILNDSQKELSNITEAYIQHCIEKSIKTLDFYKQIAIS